METFSILVNDEKKIARVGETLDVLLQKLSVAQRGVAVALNSTVIPKQEWKNTTLSPNDSILVITATQGG